jgi:orotate phosphoribosyltransferase
MRINSPDEVAKLVAFRCAPERVGHVRAVLAESGILLRGHFQLHSGLHSEYFLRVRGLAAQPRLLDELAGELLALVPGHGAQGVVCPESAGFTLGDAIARLAGIPVAVMKADINRRPSGELRAGTIAPAALVLLVNDIASSGTSLRLLHRAALAHGARVERVLTLSAVGPGALKAANDAGLTGSWLMEGQWPLVPSERCELCKHNVPLILSAELG